MFDAQCGFTMMGRSHVSIHANGSKFLDTFCDAWKLYIVLICFVIKRFTLLRYFALLCLCVSLSSKGDISVHAFLCTNGS